MVIADLHVRADGTEVMTVCVITTEGDVVCRGGNDTGLLGYGDREPRAGNHRIALPEPVYRLEIRQGDAIAARVHRPDMGIGRRNAASEGNHHARPIIRNTLQECRLGVSHPGSSDAARRRLSDG